MVGARGFEPPASRTRTVRSTRLSYAPTARLRASGEQTRKPVLGNATAQDGGEYRSAARGASHRVQDAVVLVADAPMALYRFNKSRS